MIDEILMFGARMLFWIGHYLWIDRGLQNAKGHCREKQCFRKGAKAMKNKEFKKIKMNQIGQHMMMGESVFMIQMDGSAVEIKGADLESIFLHSISGGLFAVRRKKSEGIGNFAKSIKLGRWTITINHEKKGGDADVLDAGKEC